MYVCICLGIRDTEIKEAIAQGAMTLEDLQSSLGVATCCGCCKSCVESFLPKHDERSNCNCKDCAA